MQKNTQKEFKSLCEFISHKSIKDFPEVVDSLGSLSKQLSQDGIIEKFLMI